MLSFGNLRIAFVSSSNDTPPQVLAFFLLSTLVLLGYWGWWAVLYCSRTETEASQEVTTDHHQLLQRGMYQDTKMQNAKCKMLNGR